MKPSARSCSARYEKYPDKQRFPVLAAYDQVLKCSHLFNLLDARGAISVTERVGVIKRVRDLAVGTAKIWADQQQRGGRVSLDFLLEIGTEEIPHWMIPGALAQLAKMDLLGATPQRGCDAAPAGGARRGLAGANAGSRADRQRSADLRRRKGRRGIRQEARRRAVGAAQGRATTTSWSRRSPAAPSLRHSGRIAARRDPGIQWPKTMYWTGGKTGPRFIRPIRWIVALLGDQVIPFEIAGVKSGNVTRGHRILGSSSIPVTIANYESELRKNFVILSVARAASQDREGSRGAGREARRRSARDADVHHRISRRRSAATSIRPIWNCPPKC